MLRVLVISGSGGYENSIWKVFNSFRSFDVTVSLNHETDLATDIISLYDVIVFFNMEKTISEECKEKLMRFVESDKGIVILHHAIATYPDWKWWTDEVVGGKYIFTNSSENYGSKYLDHQEIIAIPTKSHPITNFLNGLPVHIYDETYIKMWYSNEIEILLKTNLYTSDSPLLWIGPCKQSRVVVFIPGHARGAHYNVGFWKLLENSIKWAGKVLE